MSLEVCVSLGKHRVEFLMELGENPPYGRCEGGASTVRTSLTGRGPVSAILSESVVVMAKLTMK